MATRKSHHKSRLGCHQCKRRRIKCDVRYPSCANCEKRNDSCSFLMLAPSSSLSLSSTTPTESRSTLPSTLPSLSWVAVSSVSPTPQPTTSYSPTNLIVFSDEVALATQTPRHTKTTSDDPVFDFLSVTSTSTPPIVYYPELTIPPYLRFDDVWKDIREVLPLSLRDVLTHYEYTTSLTFATDDPAKAAWQSCVPEIAHSHTFLVNCVLSVASLHLGRLHDGADNKTRMNAVAAARMNKALTKYRTALENITQDNAAALFASATLTAVYLFRTSAIDIENLRKSIPPDTVVPPPATVDNMLACALRTIWGLRGPLTVLLSGWDWVLSGKLHAIAARKWWPRHCMPLTPRAVREDERLARLADMWTHSENSCGPHRTRCAHLAQALYFLRDSFNLVSQLTLPKRYPPMTAVPYSIDDSTLGVLTDRGAIFVWATRISREFIQLVEAKDRDALVLLAHYAVLPGRVRNVWWLEGLGRDLVTAVAMAVGRRDWRWVEWPAEVVGVDLEKAFGGRKDGLEGTLGEMGMEVI